MILNLKSNLTKTSDFSIKTDRQPEIYIILQHPVGVLVRQGGPDPKWGGAQNGGPHLKFVSPKG